MKGYKRIFALIVAFALFLAGCSNTDTTWVYEYEGERLPTGVLIAYQIQALTEAQTKLQTDNMANEDFTFPTEFSALLKSPLDDTTVEQWASARALEYAKSYYSIQREAARLGLSVTQEEQDYLAAAVDSDWSQRESLLTEVGIAKSSWLAYQQCEVLRSKLFDALYASGGEREMTEAELKGIFSQQYTKVNLFIMSKVTPAAEGEEDNSAAQAERKALADSFLVRLKADEAMADVEYDYRLETATTEEAKSAVEKVTDEDMTAIFHEDDAAYYNLYYPGLVDAVLALTSDEVVMIENDTYYYFLSRRDVLENSADFETYRNTLISAEKSEEFESWLVSEADALSLTANQPSIDLRKLDKLNSI